MLAFGTIIRCRSGVDNVKVRLEAVRRGCWESEESLPGRTCSAVPFLFLFNYLHQEVLLLEFVFLLTGVN